MKTKGCADMQGDIALERFMKFKDLIVSANIPGSVLLEMIENFITSNGNDDTAVENIPVLEGQLSLFDTLIEKELINI
jgi:hypothetical protein